MSYFYRHRELIKDEKYFIVYNFARELYEGDLLEEIWTGEESESVAELLNKYSAENDWLYRRAIDVFAEFMKR